jgi:hypothetical protein
MVKLKMKSIRKVYVSCPMTVSQTVLDKTLKHLSYLGVAARAWERGTLYKEEDSIKYCDAFIILLPENKFGTELYKIPSGTRKELLLAFSLNKEIYLSYIPSQSLSPSIYSTNLEEGFEDELYRIDGIAGTHRNFLDSIYHDIMKKEIAVQTQPLYYETSKFQSVEKPKKDLRLLLTI